MVGLVLILVVYMMLMFIGNLPATMNEQGLCELGQFPPGVHVRIHKKLDGTQVVHRYGLAYFQQSGEAEKLVERLNGKSVQGNTLQVREFGHRRANNERRRLDWREIPWDGPERRKSERRAWLASIQAA